MAQSLAEVALRVREYDELYGNRWDLLQAAAA
ncbi:hypothetical protein P873_01580 [Arenimonas composti TR7-09 = DSM 18010]|uniref:Uncharacterized protein n=1 Tax=Arenimonas composti TR7-09 = DSM 18010 TaxID=1121013 RepID=A0A091BSR3_9GAMM|nr:hypothetical protein P873_01580 [Arenimonas composti TR7-09 = DSM 18010]